MRLAIGIGTSKATGYMSCSTMPKMGRFRPSTASMTARRSGRPFGGSVMTPARLAAAHGHVLLIDFGQDLGVDLLQVQVADAFRVVLDELKAGGSAVFGMAGVQAQVQVLGIRCGEEGLDVLLRPHVGVGVGVELLVQPEVLQQDLPHAVVAGEQVCPLFVRQFAVLHGFARDVVAPHGRDNHNVFAAHGCSEFGYLAGGLPGFLVLLGAAVESSKDSTGADLQVTLLEFLREAGGVGRQVAIGTQFDPFVAGLCDLVQEPLPRCLLGIVREPNTP